MMFLLFFSALAEEPVVEADAERTQKIWLDDDLFVRRDLMLRGLRAIEGVDFTIPKTWALTADPMVHLRLAHSEALLPERSTISLQVNGQIIHSARLDMDNAVDGEIVAQIPRGVLEDFNTLQILAVQHVTDACEDPFDPSLWTRVHADSYLSFPHRSVPLRPDLSQFPFPLYDPLDYGPVTLSVAGITTASPAQLSALAEIGFALGRYADYRGVSLIEPTDSLSAADGHLLVFGTPAENPLVGQLLGAELPGAGEGMVAIQANPEQPDRAILVVTGGDEAGLRQAAHALATEDRHELLAGSRARIRSVADALPPASRQSPLPLPPERTFSLADIGIPDQTVRGYYSAPVSISLKMAGDANPPLDGARVGIDYAYSALLDNTLSTIEVRLNGVTLRSEALDEYNGEEKKRLWVELPYELTEPTSQLEVVFHLFPNNFNPCEYVSDRQLWATVFDTSTLEFSRDHFTDLPDLSLLRHRLWPVSTDSGSVVLVTDASGSPESAAAATLMAAHLGAASAGAAPELMATRSRAGLLAETAARHAIVLVSSSSDPTLQDLYDGRSANVSGLLDRTLELPTEELLSAKVGAAYPYIEQLIHPNSPDQTVLLLRASQPEGLVPLVERLSNPSTLYFLEGNAAALGEDGVVQTVHAVDPIRVGTVPVLRKLQMLVRESWLCLGLCLLACAFLLANLIRTWAHRRGGQV
ncbi:MAG: cellulose biosynthesis cyclic di-GMP-binding regulatory protein BcsB [Myxococcota bacterium]|nr:cellulose biosynthesis cyclic di-GMP-binding regulatory protein BcsB [Myxococcota bacterium]